MAVYRAGEKAPSRPNTNPRRMSIKEQMRGGGGGRGRAVTLTSSIVGTQRAADFFDATGRFTMAVEASSILLHTPEGRRVDASLFIGQTPEEISFALHQYDSFMRFEGQISVTKVHTNGAISTSQLKAPQVFTTFGQELLLSNTGNVHVHSNGELQSAMLEGDQMVRVAPGGREIKAAGGWPVTYDLKGYLIGVTLAEDTDFVLANCKAGTKVNFRDGHFIVGVLAANQNINGFELMEGKKVVFSPRGTFLRGTLAQDGKTVYLNPFGQEYVFSDPIGSTEGEE